MAGVPLSTVSWRECVCVCMCAHTCACASTRPGAPMPAAPCHLPGRAGQQCPLLGSSCSSQCQGPPAHPFPTVYYEGLQDKLAQIRDARGALSALREEHREKLRRAAEEAERQRQIQLAQKLEIMRQKKQVWWWRPAWPWGVGAVAACPALTPASWPPGIPGGAAAAGHPAPAGAREGAADAPGAAEADHPDAGPDASFLPALRPGTHPPHAPVPLGTLVTDKCPESGLSVSSSRQCLRRGACCTSPPARRASRAPSAQPARWRARPCTPCT